MSRKIKKLKRQIEAVESAGEYGRECLLMQIRALTETVKERADHIEMLHDLLIDKLVGEQYCHPPFGLEVSSEDGKGAKVTVQYQRGMAIAEDFASAFKRLSESEGFHVQERTRFCGDICEVALDAVGGPRCMDTYRRGLEYLRRKALIQQVALQGRGVFGVDVKSSKKTKGGAE